MSVQNTAYLNLEEKFNEWDEKIPPSKEKKIEIILDLYFLGAFPIESYNINAVPYYKILLNDIHGDNSTLSDNVDLLPKDYIELLNISPLTTKSAFTNMCDITLSFIGTGGETRCTDSESTKIFKSVYDHCMSKSIHLPNHRYLVPIDYDTCIRLIDINKQYTISSDQAQYFDNNKILSIKHTIALHVVDIYNVKSKIPLYIHFYEWWILLQCMDPSEKKEIVKNNIYKITIDNNKVTEKKNKLIKMFNELNDNSNQGLEPEHITSTGINIFVNDILEKLKIIMEANARSFDVTSTKYYNIIKDLIDDGLPIDIKTPIEYDVFSSIVKSLAKRKIVHHALNSSKLKPRSEYKKCIDILSLYSTNGDRLNNIIGTYSKTDGKKNIFDYYNKFRAGGNDKDIVRHAGSVIACSTSYFSSKFIISRSIRRLHIISINPAVKDFVNMYQKRIFWIVINNTDNIMKHDIDYEIIKTEIPTLDRSVKFHDKITSDVWEQECKNFNNYVKSPIIKQFIDINRLLILYRKLILGILNLNEDEDISKTIDLIKNLKNKLFGEQPQDSKIDNILFSQYVNSKDFFEKNTVNLNNLTSVKILVFTCSTLSQTKEILTLPFYAVNYIGLDKDKTLKNITHNHKLSIYAIGYLPFIQVNSS